MKDREDGNWNKKGGEGQSLRCLGVVGGIWVDPGIPSSIVGLCGDHSGGDIIPEFSLDFYPGIPRVEGLVHIYLGGVFKVNAVIMDALPTEFLIDVDFLINSAEYCWSGQE
ncbi:hypothetical protein O181_007458 [Austropuccinia psidii MF-1]|uniref:Uncharacterized protein n=1 Tax=Austropuccinia psidii MF-1 TaxID=1389203 RepID=A0A9Q3BMG6_9BASI|nr:hypothetical protein [Austropuccinia psidii MF-1]